MSTKTRLDARLLELYPQYSRTQIQSFILQGKVTVNGKPAAKAGSAVLKTDDVQLKNEAPKYVSRAGFKLEHALSTFNVDVSGKTVLDAGISTGGFTDCLLQHGAKKVYGIDVGYGQVHEKIAQDPRVTVLERTNLRTYKHAGDPIDLITLDLSFISITKVLDTVLATLKPDGTLITLIKPQFEAGKGQVPRGGVIKDASQRDEIVQSVVQEIESSGLKCHGITQSPITGTSGNIEYLAVFRRIRNGLPD